MDAHADFADLLLALLDAGVDFVVVGGVAAFVEGAPLVTLDLDIVHERSEANVTRLLALMDAQGAESRERPGLRPGRDALRGPGYQLLRTRLGDLDVLGAIDEGLSYADLLPDTVAYTLRGRTLRVLSLERLIELKRRSPRPKDQAALPVLEEVFRARAPD